jgi:hypothetical protein
MRGNHTGPHGSGVPVFKNKSQQRGWALGHILCVHFIVSLTCPARTLQGKYYLILVVRHKSKRGRFSIASLNTQTMKPSSVIYRERRENRAASEQIVIQT